MMPWDGLRRHYHAYRTLLQVALVATMAHLGYGILSQSAIPPYVQELGFTRYIGIIYAAFLLTETLLKFPMGLLEDRIGLRPVYLIATLVGATASFAWTLAKTLWLMLGVRIVDGAGSAAIWTATVLAMSEAVEAEQRTFAMSVFLATYLGGLALGPFIGGVANDQTHSKLTSFYLTAVLFLLAGVLAYFLLPGTAQPRAEGTPRPPALARGFLRQIWPALRAIPDFMLVAFRSFFAIGLLIPIIKLFAMNQLGMSETTYGLIVLPVVLSLMLISFATGNIVKVLGQVRAIQLGLLISALAMFSVPLIHRQWEFALAAGVVGLGFAIGMPAWLALITELTPLQMRGSIIGALGTVQGVGIILGTVLSSFLYLDLPLHLGPLHLQCPLHPISVERSGVNLLLPAGHLFSL